MHISNTEHNNSPLDMLKPRCLDDHTGVGICNCVDWNIQWIFRVLAWNAEWHSRIRWQGPLCHVKINLAWLMQAGLRIRFNCSFMPCKVGEPSASPTNTSHAQVYGFKDPNVKDSHTNPDYLVTLIW